MTENLKSIGDPTLKPPKTILLVDDQDDCRIMTKWVLSNFGYTVESARSAEEGLVLFDPQIHDIVVTDNSMPGMKGGEMAHIIKLRSPTTPVLMYSGQPPPNTSCLDAVLRKPIHLLTLKEEVERLLAARPPFIPPTSMPANLNKRNR